MRSVMDRTNGNDEARRAMAVGLAFFLLGLVLRIVACFWVVPAWEEAAGVAAAPDGYPDLARSLVDDGVLGYPPPGASPTTVRGPGFPVWLAGGILIGTDGSRWLGLWGSLPGLFAGVLLAWLLARRLGVAAGVLGGVVAVAHPLSLFVAARTMGDDFYGALGFVALVCLTIALDRPKTRETLAWTALAGALLAAQMLTRATGLLTLLAAVAIVVLRRPIRWRQLAVLIVVALLPPLTWSVRTSLLEGRAVFVHSLAAYNFWVGEGLDRYGAGDATGGHWADITALVLDTAGKRDVDSRRFWYGTLAPREAAKIERVLGRKAVERVRDEPLGYAARFARGIGRFWIQAMTRTRTLQYVAVVVPVLVLAIVGVVRLRSAHPERDPLPLLLIVTIVLHNVAYAATLPAARLSVQVYLALAYLAGAAALSRPRLRTMMDGHWPSGGDQG